MRVTAWATPVAVAALAAVLGMLDAVPWPEAVLVSISVALALVPSGWWASGSTRRRLAEASLVPVAFAMTMIGSGIMRRMVLPPLLLLAIWAVAAASWDRVPSRRRPLFAIFLGLAARAATGLGLSGVEALPLALTVVLAAALPWMAARRWGPRVAEVAALFGGVLPWYRWPLAAIFVTALTVILSVAGRNRHSDRFPSEWVPGVGSAVLFTAALAPWPGLDVSQVFPGIGWLTWTAVIAALAVTPLLRPGTAGVVWLAVSLSFGSVQVPSPEQRAFFLTDELGELTMSAGNGGDYVVDLDVRSEIVLADDVPLAMLRYDGADHPISLDSANGSLVWRPHGTGARTRWRASHRSSFDVPDGERPVLFRHPDLPKSVGVRVETIGAVRATPPRDWRLDRWVMAAALVVALIQLLSGVWRSTIGSVPWLLLVFGSLVMRAPIEPLRLLAERLAVDLALASLLVAWVPACRVWFARKRVFVAMAALLVPLALATPHVTPPLYGDEPFHLVVMESLADDYDFDITNNLDLEHHPQNQLYAPGRPLFHSPVLGSILFPGYLIGGRAGALALLALMGAVLVVLVARRSRDLGLDESAIGASVMVLAVTYPVATYATQIWPELPGALAVALLLLLVASSRSRWASVLLVAVTAAAIKTRLGLLTLPIAASSSVRRRPVRTVLVLTLAATAILAFGWLTMGHPFGPYRRLHHLLPTDPGLAVRVFGGLAFDAAGGLAFTAPLLLASLAGVTLLWKRGGPGERALLLGGVLTLAALLHSPEWYGGGAPPARYLVPMLPAFALAGGLVFAHPRRWRRLLPLLLPPSIVAWWALVSRPHLSVNPGDGGYWLADALSRRFSADARSLFPSFLTVNTAAVLVPLAILLIVALVVWAGARWPLVRLSCMRGWIALWIVAASALVLTLGLRTDRVVEAEAPQVRKNGGRPVPLPGTVARYTHRGGWRLNDGNHITVPLKLEGENEVVIEGWLLGTAQRRCELALKWDDAEPTVVAWQGDGSTERLRMPAPPGEGRHRLSIELRSSPHGAVVLDRLIVERRDFPGP